jgi:hypothetical protein
MLTTPPPLDLLRVGTKKLTVNGTFDLTPGLKPQSGCFTAPPGRFASDAANATTEQSTKKICFWL